MSSRLEPYVNQERRLPFRGPGWWVISDTHWFHRNISVYEPVRQTLDGDHNYVMLRRWNEVVDDDDFIVHLGDLALGRAEQFDQIASRIRGRKFLLKGNHDKRSAKWYAARGFVVIPEFWLEYRDWSIRFSHEPSDIVQYPNHLNVHGHVHSASRKDSRYVNVSVEVVNFRPVWVPNILDERINTLEGK